jgi:hypothetical protein
MILEALLIKALLAAVDTGRTWRGVSALTASAVLAGGIVLYPVLLYFYSGVSPVRVFHRHLDIYCIQGLTTALAGLPVFRLLDRAAAGGAE